MSVLSFPRIYFQGYMEWDPCTFNNNDWQEFPTYDGVNAALNWPFLATQGVTQQNFYTALRPWAITLQPDCAQGDQPTGDRIPAEWNMFGTHGVSFAQYSAGDIATTITGGALSATDPVTSDPLIGQPVAVTGDGGGPGRLVDVNPASFWSSQVYFAKLAFGGGDYVIGGPRKFRMHSRWLDLSRIYNADPALTQPAASVGCCFQTSIPYDEVSWPASGGSALANALKQAANTPPAIGIMVRFTAYVNVYFKNGILNDIQQCPRNYEELAKVLELAWKSFNSTGSTSLFFSNPCYSHIVGTLGVWDEGEVATVPVGRFLAASNAVAPQGGASIGAPAATLGRGHQAMAASSAQAAPPTVPLGPAVVSVDYQNELISIDLNSTIPELGQLGEWPSDLTKANFGSLDFGVVTGGSFISIVQIAYDQYARGPYEASAGIIDIPFSKTIDPANTATHLRSGAIAIRVQQRTTPQTALLEQQLSAQTDSRGIYLDQGQTTSFDISVYNFGAPSPTTNVLIAQYDQGLNLIPTQAQPLIVFNSGKQSTITSAGITTNVTVVTADANGVANLQIGSNLPGFAVLAFYPYADNTGTTLPSPLPSLFGPTMPITSAFYATIRVLPFDDAVPQQFVDLWNANQNQTEAWNFVYNEILYLYDMIFNVMLEFVNLGSQSAVESSIPYIWPVISAEFAKENTLAMPITRDLSAGKRKTLQLWMYLVASNFNVPNFNVNSIPSGWSPSGGKGA